MADPIRCQFCGANVKADNHVAHMRKVHPNVAFEPRGGVRANRSKRIRYLTSNAKKAIFAVVLVAVFTFAASMLYRSAEKGTPVDTSATVVRVSMSGFSPNTITVQAGTVLKIDLINMDNSYHADGGGWHNFAIDDFSMNVTVEPLGQKVFAVPASGAGTYGWYCSICCGGRESPAMNGRVIVEP